jgi:hypothetical protein
MGEWVCIDPHFLDLSTSWRWVVSFTPQSLCPEERAPGTHWIGGWVDLRVGLDDVEKRKFLTLPGLELRLLGRPARSYSLYRLRYPAYGLLKLVRSLVHRRLLDTRGIQLDVHGTPVTAAINLTNQDRTFRRVPAPLLCKFILSLYEKSMEGARGNVVGWGTMLQAGRSRDRILMR